MKRSDGKFADDCCVSHALTAVARDCDNVMLFDASPVLSVWPSISMTRSVMTKSFSSAARVFLASAEKFALPVSKLMLQLRLPTRFVIAAPDVYEGMSVDVTFVGTALARSCT